MIKEVELLNDYMFFIDSFHIDDLFIDPNSCILEDVELKIE